MKNLHILTLSWNGESKLKELYTGLMQNLDALGYMQDGKFISDKRAVWHVRDNGSKDGSIKYLESLKNSSTPTHEIKIYPINHNNNNFSQGMNYLFQQAKPNDDDLVLLLNNDIVFGDDTSLLKMIKLQEKTESDIVGARLLYKGTSNIQHAGVVFSQTKYGQNPWHLKVKTPTDKTVESNKHFQAVTAAVMLTTASAYKKVGGLDERYQWCFEDVHYNLAVNQLKPNNVSYCGETLIYHEESATLKITNVNKLFMDSNVKLFKSSWSGKYDFDHEKYLNDKNYRIIK